MKQRCNNEKSPNYPGYGGRGIAVSEEWSMFENFYKDMREEYNAHVILFGESETTLDRIDNDGNYCVENCRWATKKLQATNRSRPGQRKVTLDGVINLYSAVEVAEILGVSKSAVHAMYREARIPKPAARIGNTFGWTDKQIDFMKKKRINEEEVSK
jgi:predicted DNA-binding transcriptional regulator AlpA